MQISPSSAFSIPLSTQRYDDTQLERIFYPVSEAVNPDKLPVISEIFHRILTPLYGAQEKAIEQIRASEDRRCFLLYEGETPVAVLVFKTILSREFAEFGVDNSIEIKSLFVDHSANNSGKGLGSALVEKLVREVEQLHVGNEAIHVTVSETKQESLNFFRKKGFEIRHTWDGRYLPGIKEYLLALPTSIMTRTASQYAVVGRENIRTRNIYQLSFTVTNAHQGDVHVLLKLSYQTFISGSEDGSLYTWIRYGELLYVVDALETTTGKDSNCSTAAEEINDK